MRKGKEVSTLKIAQKKAAKRQKRKQRKTATKNKPSSPRELHIAKNTSEKETYLHNISILKDLNTNDNANTEIKEKEFKELKIAPKIPSTTIEEQDANQTARGNATASIDKNTTEESWWNRLKNYWVRNYPELIVKEILVKLLSLVIGTVIIGVFSFIIGQKSASKEIKGLIEEILLIKEQAKTTTENIQRQNDAINRLKEGLNQKDHDFKNNKTIDSQNTQSTANTEPKNQLNIIKCIQTGLE
ncbi:hypothetical protein ACFL08_04075 [Patescibacteria group bacterium]